MNAVMIFPRVIMMNAVMIFPRVIMMNAVVIFPRENAVVIFEDVLLSFSNYI